MNIEIAPRQKLSDEPFDVLRRLPLMGKVMIVARDGGVTHERIGPVERLQKQGTFLFCIGDAHNAKIDLSSISTIVIDRSGRMKEKVLPKLEFQNVAGDLLFSVIGLDNSEKFEAGVAPFSGSPLALPEKPASEQAALSNDDPGFVPLNAAIKANAEIEVRMDLPGVSQAWRGTLPPINPAMGFINIITPDFHLHLRGGTVAKWQRRDPGPDGKIELAAIGHDGKPVGLVLTGAQDTFGPV